MNPEHRGNYIFREALNLMSQYEYRKFIFTVGAAFAAAGSISEAFVESDANGAIALAALTAVFVISQLTDAYLRRRVNRANRARENLE